MWKKFSLALLLCLFVPYLGMSNSFLFEIFIQIGIFAVLALGLNVVVGLAGLLDLGFMAFFAVGAYTWAIFSSPQITSIFPSIAPFSGIWFYAFLPLAMLFAIGLGCLVGLPSLRLRGDYLAIVTLGFGEMIRVLANNLDHPLNITNGPQGITPVQQPPVTWIVDWLSIPHALATSLFFYFFILVLIGIIIVINLHLKHSRFGRAWMAIRENELAAQAMGISLARTKLLAFITGASFSGLMGAVYAAKQTFISPESFTLLQSIMILCMVILGGAGSIAGAIVGAIVITLLNIEILPALTEHLSAITHIDFSEYQRLIFGVILVSMMIFRPQGLIARKNHV